ncbi:unnamed protein product [Arabis nemorensis]|uniref:SANT domain-containing protein n=1 Tax=Arabis nemorensis TaxID=586526 RepID=A0A565AZP7_9BRAS|nr:unnamed protein product [Arabis nemorensis]
MLTVLVMDEENSPMEDSCDVEFVCGDPKVDIRVGDEYQAEIPPMMSESKRASFLLSPIALDLDSDSSCSFVVGLPVEVMWIDTKYRDGKGVGDDQVDLNESLKSLKTKRSRRCESDGNPGSKQWMNLEAVPMKSSSSWEDLEVDGFVLGLYTFGKNFTQVKKLLGSKETGEVLLFYYGKFYRSAKYKIWSNSLKKRSRKCIQGKKLYSGWRLQQLLSRLIPSLADEPQKKMLVDVSKSFAEGNTSLEEYISSVKELVGLQSLVEAVAIGREKEDLTVLTTEPTKAKQWFTVSSAVAAGLGAYTSLTSEEIINKLTGGSRLSKARCNDIFWEAVWPRLLARGWHSEQPKDRCHIKSKDHIVFIVPGVKKFSRRKLVKQNHYFDSISDILTKVISEPDLLEFETAEIRAPSGFIEEKICDQSNQEKHRYLRFQKSSTHIKFTVVDTTSLATGGKLCQFRELKNPNPESLISKLKAGQGDNKSSMERFQMMPLDVQKRARFADERRRMKKLVDDPVRFMIVDTSVDHAVQSSGLRRRRHLPSECISREAFVDSSQNQSDTNTGVNCEYPKGTDSGVKEESLENVQQGCSKKKFARKSESNNHHLVSSLPLPKRRRLSACVRKDIERSGGSSVLKPPALDQTTKSLKTNQSEETENGMSLHVEIQGRPEIEPNGLCPVLETVNELSSSAQQQEPNGLCSISVLDTHWPSKEQGALHELSSSEKQQDESNLLCRDKKCSSKDLETAQHQEKSIQLPTMAGSDKKSPSTNHGNTWEQQEEAHNQQTNLDLPRRLSTRKRPLTTRALEALESGFLTAKSMKCTSKPRKRERSTKIKHSANGSNRSQGESHNGFHVKEETASKRLDDIEDSEPSFLVDKATTASKHVVDQIQNSKKVTTEYPKLPPIVLKLPFKRG